MAGNTGEGEDERSPWTRPAFVASAAVVLMIVVLGLALLVSAPGGTGESAPDANAPAGRDPTGSVPATPTSASACGLPGGSARVTKAPAVSWELAGKIAVPTAPRTAGPGVEKNGLRSCFARSPLGALFAAVNAIAMTASDEQRGPFIRSSVAAGVGRKRALAVLEDTPTNEGSDTVLQVAGFQVVDYSRFSAVIDLALRIVSRDRTGLVHVPVALRWEQGDWKLAVPDTGLPFDAMTRIPSLGDDYIAWSGA